MVLPLVESYSLGCCALAACWDIKLPRDCHCRIYKWLTWLLLSNSRKSSFVTLALVSVAEARELCLVTSWSGWLPADWDTPLTVIYNGVGWWQWDVCGTVVHRFLNTYSKVFPAGCHLVSQISPPTILLVVPSIAFIAECCHPLPQKNNVSLRITEFWSQVLILSQVPPSS